MPDPRDPDKKPADTGEPSRPGVLGDGTEEQNLDQPGDPDARIGEDEVEEAFKGAPVGERGG